MGLTNTSAPRAGLRTAFLVVDTESVPDGRLLAAVKYPGENLSAEAAVARATDCEPGGSAPDGLPVSFRVPVAVGVLRVGPDFALQGVSCLDAPHFRPPEIVRTFWLGVACDAAKLVTFNGRRFDMPLLELAAFRYGYSAREYYQNSRNRFGGPIDLTDWLTNFGACHLTGGLDLLAKLLGKPGKMTAAGEPAYQLYRAGKLQEINDGCLCATLDTYFVFLRTRILTGDLTLEQESHLVGRAKELLRAKVAEFPVLGRYLDDWTDFQSM
jgi:predicted PolB exonuclease-like 3'-5' exonuclease